MDIFAEVKARANIYDVLREFGIKVDRNGRINCPFHNDHSPSCKIYKETNSYYCYACGSGGDCIRFVQDYLKLDKLESAKWLARIYGIEDSIKETAKERENRLLRLQERCREEEKERKMAENVRTLVQYHQMLKDGIAEGKITEFCKMDSLIEEWIDCALFGPDEFDKCYGRVVVKVEDRLRKADKGR